METLLLDARNSGDVDRAVVVLKDEGSVAVPTETVYGLAANMFSESAVNSVFLAKRRSFENPLTVHIAHLSQFWDVADNIDERAAALAKIFWPGPLTLVVKKSRIVPDFVTASTDYVGVRFPSGCVIRELIDGLCFPVVAPSANVSGGISPTCFLHVFNEMNHRVNAILRGDDEIFLGVESTVVSLVGGTPKILRMGAISVEDISRVIGNAKLELSGEFSHYKLNRGFTVVAVKCVNCSFSDFINKKEDDGVAALCFTEDGNKINGVPCVTYGPIDDFFEQGRNLYSAMKKLETLPDRVSKVYVHLPESVGLGCSIYSKIMEFSQFNVIEI